MELTLHKFWCLVSCFNCMGMFASSSSSDMLIIRHGRSRVRHSSEKDHIRWGLKAFDLEFNSTIYEYDNDTMELNGNQSFYGDNSSDLFYINNSGERIGSSSLSPPEYQYRTTKDNDEEGGTYKATVSTPKTKLAKKQIMANIRKTVEKGVEYLKSHAHLNKDNIEINSVMPTITENNSNNKDVNGNSLKSDNNNILLSPLLDDITSTSTSITQTKENHVQNDDGEAQLRQLNITPTSSHSNIKKNPFNSSAFNTKFKNNNSEQQSNVMSRKNDTINNDMKSLQKHEQMKIQKSEMHIRGNTNNQIDDDEDKIDENTEKPSLFDETAFSDSGDYGSESMPSGLYSENNEQANTEDDSQIGISDNEKNVRRLDEYVDLKGLDETSRNNRLNLMRGKDLLTTFLRIVETQHLLGSNCTAGTALNLGEGVVDRYAHDRFRVEAEIAVNRANMLTRIFKLTAPAVQESEQLLHASVLSMVEFDDDIFAAGNCFDWNQHPKKKGLFCPFAFRLPYPNHGASLAKDLAAEYHYLGNTSEWFFLARKNAERVIAKNEQYIKAYHLYSNSTEREVDKILSVKYEDGRWSKPYYDCGGGNIWMLTYTVPFFGHDNGTYFFKGTSGIDIDLRRVDIDQCPQRQVPGITQPLNIFAGTDKCKQRTTECEAISGLGFRRGSYKCICRKGFYFPDTSIPQKYFNGSTLEEEYEKLMLKKELSTYSNPNSYQCLPCAEGCDACKDASPCVAALNWPMRTSILVLACAVIGFLPPAAYFTFRYQQVKVLRAASPALLRVIALGAFFIYCTSIVMYPNPSLYTCTARIWLREIGFSLTYGALMLKTWRISVIFRVRSAKAVKITDAGNSFCHCTLATSMNTGMTGVISGDPSDMSFPLLKRLGVLCGCISVALLIRTIVAPPVVVVGRTADDLKAFLCKTNWWDHTFTSMEVLFLAWGVRLCIMVRKAPSEFNESRFISMAIYNEFLLTCFLNVSMLFLQSPANPDLLYIIFFCHTQLTVTLLLALIFGSKVYLVFRSGGKPSEDTMGLGVKSSGAKFICRSQARTLANPSTATSSTAQLGANADSRLTEQEALEHIKQLYSELQNLHERVPPRGIAVATISSLLESCRTSHQLKPPIKSALTNAVLIRSDKSTNTTFVIDLKQNGNGITHLSITDEKCAVLSLLKSVDETENQNQIKDIEDKSLFLNLPLECMCTCGGMEMNDVVNTCEHSSSQTKCSHYSNKTVEHMNQQQNDQNGKKCNDNSQKLDDANTNCINSKSTCEQCSRNSNKLNVTEYCSSKCDCTHRFEANSCSVHLASKSNKNVNLVSNKSLDDDQITSESNEISTLLNKPEMYDRIGLSLSESFENTEAEAAHVQPTTPSPIISISSSAGGDDDRLNRDNQTPSLVSPMENDDEKLSTVKDSCSSNNISMTTDASGTSTSAGNGAGKRGKTDGKLVLDLNDRSKYTKEVSV